LASPDEFFCSLGPDHGLERDSVSDCEDLCTVSSDRLTRRIDEVDVRAQQSVDRAVRIALASQP
jgi:mRNA-degrading endonuclease toxin of MazEF toxin-antitoxin module